MFDINGYNEAASLEEALEFLKETDSQIIAGGTDVLIKTRERKNGYVSKNLVGIKRIKELNGINTDGDGNILIGPCTSFTKVEEDEIIKKYIPGLAIAAGSVGGPQIRNMGTIGGNVCNGATSADTASILFALNAKLVIKSLEVEREVDIKDFYLGPGKVELKNGEILRMIKILKQDYEGFASHYIKFSQRKAMDISTLGCSVLLKTDGGSKIDELRIAYGVAGPTPLRAVEAEKLAAGLAITDENLESIGEKCIECCHARDSWRASKAFRENLIKELAVRAIKVCMKNPDKNSDKNPKEAVKL